MRTRHEKMFQELTNYFLLQDFLSSSYNTLSSYSYVVRLILSRNVTISYLYLEINFFKVDFDATN